MASLHLLQPLTFLSSHSAPLFSQYSHPIRFKPSFAQKPLSPKPLTLSFALAESDSAKSLEPDPQVLLQELADSFDLSRDYFEKLPRDLRLDLNDAAFDLSNGPVIDECGQEMGEILLNLSRAWEVADTSTSHTLVSKLPSLVQSLTENYKSGLGKRLISAGRRFQSMGQYGQGELQKIAKAMNTTGKLLSASSAPKVAEQPKNETRMFKFGELQVELTVDKANIGAAIGVVFGVISWQLGQGVQSIPESSLQYANDNALLLAKDLEQQFDWLIYPSGIILEHFTFKHKVLFMNVFTVMLVQSMLPIVACQIFRLCLSRMCCSWSDTHSKPSFTCFHVK
ncbi:uncharacterized protein LOC111485488 isoform X1 [Cucurbita maxima]|uniref:Uncharacterized protein LOC111485488 isoform X1 n=1 Tax=Cucurbita maxima TaxID=3661 RepID=A0A6J1JIU7_CUCMA|nr:uncharacterized protein LOC111485488 isoform X1 [Cucurbita maxima]